MLDEIGVQFLLNIFIVVCTFVGTWISIKNYQKKITKPSWTILLVSSLVFWSLTHLIIVFIDFNSSLIKVLNLILLSFLMVGFWFAYRKNKLFSSAVFSFIFGFLLIGEVLIQATRQSLWWWIGSLCQVQGISLWILVLFFPRLEYKYRKEETKLQGVIVEKEDFINMNKKSYEESFRRISHLEELHKQTLRRMNKLSIFFQVSKDLGSMVERDRILEVICEEMVKIWQVQVCAVYLVQNSSEELVLKYAQGLEQNLVGRISFQKGEGLVGWVALEGKPVRLLEPQKDPRFKDKYNFLLKAKKIDHKAVLLVPLRVNDKVLGVIEIINNIAWKDIASRAEFTDEDENLLMTLANQIALSLENIYQYEETRDVYLDIIRSLVNAIEARDCYTRGHSDQTTKYAVAIAHKLGLSSEETDIIKYAASLHDIGKIGIKESILKKPKKLTVDEYSHIKNHPFVGAQIIKPIKSLQDLVPIIYHHHERYDGQGYMDGLKKEAIPIGARILCVADAFEAMTSDRPYRKSLSRQEAIEQLERYAGTQFDPQVVKSFLELLEEEDGNLPISRAS